MLWIGAPPLPARVGELGSVDIYGCGAGLIKLPSFVVREGRTCWAYSMASGAKLDQLAANPPGTRLIWPPGLGCERLAVAKITAPFAPCQRPIGPRRRHNHNCPQALALVTKRRICLVALSVCFVAYSCPKTATHFSGIRLALITKRRICFVALSVCFVAYSCPKTATHFSGIRLALVTKRRICSVALSFCLCVSFFPKPVPAFG